MRPGLPHPLGNRTDFAEIRMKLLRELIDIPESLPANRFVLRLSEGTKERLGALFEEALE